MPATVDQAHRENNQSFETVVREAVSESLGLLGESQKAAVAVLLRRDYHVDVDSPGTDLEQVFSALKGLFGEGAPFLIELIVRNLSSKLSAPAPSLRM